MSQDRRAYFAARRLALKAKKASAANYPSLASCLAMDDAAVIQAYAERGEEPPTLRYFEDRRRPLYIPERDIVEQPWTEADAAADRRRHAEHVAALQRTRLFCFGVSAYIEGLSDNQVLAELTKLDSTWETKSIRYTKPEELRRELGDALYAAEAQEETA